MARDYRLGPGRKAVNVAMSALLRLGVPAPQRTSYLMTTKGRKTGLDRTTPVNLLEDGGERWLVSPYGDVGWVHNLGPIRSSSSGAADTASRCAPKRSGPPKRDRSSSATSARSE
jgi:hypothetical protein